MRVLLAHEHYRSGAPSGEDAVFRNERELLEHKGLEVIPFERFNDDIDDSRFRQRIGVARNAAWSRRIYEELSQVIRSTRPHIAHFHNTFPLISSSAYAACQDGGVPVVQTLHNYRLICAGGLLLRDGRPCEDCIGKTLLPALAHRCYRGSLPATGAVVWMLARNRWRGSYATLVNRYIALTRFAAARLIAGGLPAERMEIKPNFLSNAPSVGNGGGGYAVYAGRLSAEKGVVTLVKAWKRSDGFVLVIMGDGPLRQQLEQQVADERLPVRLLGVRPREEVLKVVSGAQLQIVPSEWYEGFPMSVIEAYACGTPVVASRIGSLDEIVREGETGAKFAPGDAEDLRRQVDRLRNDPDALEGMRATTRAVFDSSYGPDDNFAKLMEIYENAMQDFEHHKRAGLPSATCDRRSEL